MTLPTLKALEAQIGPNNVIGFFLVLARVGPLFIIAPLFSSKMVPARVRGIAAVGIAIGLTGVAVHGLKLPTDPIAVAGLILVQILVGLGLAFAISVLIAAIEGAGGLIDMLAGFSFSGMVDPVNGVQSGPMSQLYSLVGLMIFIAVGGDAWTLRGLTRTFTLVPLDGGVKLQPLASGAATAFGALTTAAIEVAAPAMLALVITDIAFGMVSRVVPQINVFAVGFPVKVGVTLLLGAAALPFVGGWLTNQLQASVGTALSVLHVG
jgi:flagellar biosynthetic protein FliR